MKSWSASLPRHAVYRCSSPKRRTQPASPRPRRAGALRAPAAPSSGVGLGRDDRAPRVAPDGGLAGSAGQRRAPAQGDDAPRATHPAHRQCAARCATISCGSPRSPPRTRASGPRPARSRARAGARARRPRARRRRPRRSARSGAPGRAVGQGRQGPRGLGARRALAGRAGRGTRANSGPNSGERWLRAGGPPAPHLDAALVRREGDGRRELRLAVNNRRRRLCGRSGRPPTSRRGGGARATRGWRCAASAAVAATTRRAAWVGAGRANAGPEPRRSDPAASAVPLCGAGMPRRGVAAQPSAAESPRAATTAQPRAAVPP